MRRRRRNARVSAESREDRYCVITGDFLSRFEAGRLHFCVFLYHRKTLFTMLMSTARAAVMPAKAGAKTSRPSMKFTCPGKPSHLVRAARLPSLTPSVFVGKDDSTQGLDARVAGKVSAANVPGEIVSVNAAAADGTCLVRVGCLCDVRILVDIGIGAPGHRGTGVAPVETCRLDPVIFVFPRPTLWVLTAYSASCAALGTQVASSGAPISRSWVPVSPSRRRCGSSRPRRA